MITGTDIGEFQLPRQHLRPRLILLAASPSTGFPLRGFRTTRQDADGQEV
jgi:hypothetical protein